MKNISTLRKLKQQRRKQMSKNKECFLYGMWLGFSLGLLGFVPILSFICYLDKVFTSMFC